MLAKSLAAERSWSNNPMNMNASLQIALAEQVSGALREDVGSGDLTASLIPADRLATATVISRENAILCGRAWFEAVFAQLSAKVRIEWLAEEGAAVHADQTLCKLEGPARAILTGERTALNFLQTLSATATVTRRYVDAVAGTTTRILDTRKTIPGLRLAQKYAVHCGGGTNHRVGLFDGVLVKENHIAAAGSIAAAVGHARRVAGKLLVEVEVETLDQLRLALQTDVDRVMLDNFDLAQTREAVALVRASGSRIQLEASGNVTLATIRQVAETGVDYISIGSLTKHVQALDLSMRFTMQ